MRAARTLFILRVSLQSFGFWFCHPSSPPFFFVLLQPFNHSIPKRPNPPKRQDPTVGASLCTTTSESLANPEACRIGEEIPDRRGKWHFRSDPTRWDLFWTRSWDGKVWLCCYPMLLLASFLRGSRAVKKPKRKKENKLPDVQIFRLLNPTHVSTLIPTAAGPSHQHRVDSDDCARPIPPPIRLATFPLAQLCRAFLQQPYWLPFSGRAGTVDSHRSLTEGAKLLRVSLPPRPPTFGFYSTSPFALNPTSSTSSF